MSFLIAAPVVASDLTPVTLKPVVVSKIPIKDPETVRAVQSTGNGIWVLEGTRTYSELVLTTSQGIEKQRIFLMKNATDYIQDFCVNEDGSFATLHRENRLSLYLSTGELERTVPIDAHSFGCAFAAGDLYLIDKTDVVRVSTGLSITSFPNPLLWPVIVVPLHGRRVAAVEAGESRLSVANIEGSGIEQFTLSAREIQGISRAARTQLGVEAQAYAATSDDQGNLFVATSPYSVADGAIVLKFSAGGILSASYRCVLPIGPDLKTATIADGHFVPSHLAVFNNELVLISRSQKSMAKYLLK